MSRVLTASKSLAKRFPSIAAEWHPDLNGKLLPSKVFAGSARVVWWQCRRNSAHEWRASICNRTGRRSNCPLCRFQTSALELRLFSEIRYLFPDALLKSRIAGLECDVVIPSLKVALEIDGYYWHKSKQVSDTRKIRKVRAAGYKIFRLRQTGLKRVTRDDLIFTENNDLKLRTIQAAVRKIWKLAGIDPNPRTSRYLNGSHFHNNELYLKLHGRKLSPYKGRSLREKFPRLSAEWHVERNGSLTPSEISAFSQRIVWWRCTTKRDHIYEASVSNRTRRGNGCPYCSGRRAHPKDNLVVHFPKIAVEWHPTRNGDLRPEDVKPYSNIKRWWTCKRSRLHDYEATPNARVHGSGCAYCANKKTCADNSLATLYPKLLKEWDFARNGKLTPTQVNPGSHKRVWWRCSKNKTHIWRAVINSRTKRQGAGCPYCNGNRVHAQHNLQAANPKVAAEWHPKRNGKLRPTDVTPSSGRKVWWQCRKALDHAWQAAVYNRSKPGGTGCPYCDGKKVAIDNCLATVRPDLAREWHPSKNRSLSPKDVTSNSNRKVWWQCKLDRHHVWDETPSVRTRGGGCPYCSNHRVNWTNSLRSLRPDLAKEWDARKNRKLTPDTVAIGSAYRVWWICKSNPDHTWRAQIRDRTKQQGTGCPECFEERRGQSSRLGIELMRKTAKERRGVCLSKHYVNNATHLRWQCSQGHVWQATPKSVVQHHSWCPECAKMRSKNSHLREKTLGFRHKSLSKK